MKESVQLKQENFQLLSEEIVRPSRAGSPLIEPTSRSITFSSLTPFVSAVGFTPSIAALIISESSRLRRLERPSSSPTRERAFMRTTASGWWPV
jgi:hypothetical protein